MTLIVCGLRISYLFLNQVLGCGLVYYLSELHGEVERLQGLFGILHVRLDRAQEVSLAVATQCLLEDSC